VLSVLVATVGGLFAPGERVSAALEGRRVDAIARDGDALWAIVDEHSVWRHTPEQQWQSVAMVEERRLNCLGPHRGRLLLGTSAAHLFALRDGEVDVVSSFDAAPGRESWFTPWGGPPDVRSMARDDDGGLFVNVHVGGILRSDDLEGWTPTIEMSSDVHEVVVDRGRVLAATAWGLGTSEDHGATWTFHRAGLHDSYARAVTVCSDAVLLSASEGPRGRRAAIYRLAQGAEGFVKCEEGLPAWFDHNIDTGCLAGRGTSAVAATEEGDVFISQDSGLTWRQLADDLPAARWVELLP
jgi:hypothetical protein